MAAATDKLRQNLHLVPTSSVRLVIEPSSEDGSTVPYFECIGCEEFLVRDATSGWWKCPECEYEVRFQEARALLQKSLKTLVAEEKKRTGGGLWARLFSRSTTSP
jgi:hypothetical protein